MILGGRADRTFDRAAESYIQQGGSPRYTDSVVEYFRGRPVDTIVPAEVRQMAFKLYPGRKASTINRQALTPARALLYHAHELGWCPAMRIRHLKTEKSTKHHSVNGDWISKFISQADADGLFHLSAMVFFMHHSAARVSEACNLLGDHVDLWRRISREALCNST